MTDTLVRPDIEGEDFLKTIRMVDFGSTLEKTFNAFAKSDEKKAGAWTASKNEAGASIITRERVPVFRSGEFADSMGYRHKWMSIHMRQMVDHFGILSESGQFADVPIRRGHGSLFGDPIDSLIGYVKSLSMEKRTSPVDGKEYDYLLADVEIIDPDAQEKIQSGLWRNLSSEIGLYIDNDEAEYWPVFKGFAYVDIPAVEGLKEFSKSHASNRTIIEGETMTTDSKITPPQVNSDHGKRETFAFTINGEATTDFTKVQNYVKQMETRNTELTAQVTELSEFKKEAITKERESFVDQLAKDGKIVQAQVDDAKEFAKGMSDDQFKMYQKMHDASAPLPIMQEHGVTQTPPVASHSQGGTGAGASNADEAKAERVEILTEIVYGHAASVTPEALKELPSYKELMELNPSFTLAR